MHGLVSIFPILVIFYVHCPFFMSMSIFHVHQDGQVVVNVHFGSGAFPGMTPDLGVTRTTVMLFDILASVRLFGTCSFSEHSVFPGKAPDRVSFR